MNKKQVTTALFVILIIASFLRIYNLMPMGKTGVFSPPGLYPDEAMNGNNITEAMTAKDLKIFYPENFGREGLFMNIQGLFIRAMGNHPWALRLPSAIFGILTVLGMYLLSRQLYANENLALFSAFLLATSYWHVHFSRIGFRAIMAPAFLVWGIYLFLKSLSQPQIDSFKKWMIPVCGGLIYGLGFYSYIAYRATPLLMLGITWLIWRKYRSENLTFPYREFLIFTAVAILTAMPMGIYFLQHPADFFGRTAGISIFNSQSPVFDLAFNVVKTLGMFNVVGDFNWRHNLAGSPQLSIPVGIFFLYGIWLVIKKIRLEKLAAIPELILLGWFLIVMLPVIVSNEGLPHALRAILMIPPVLMLAAYGGVAAYNFLTAHLSPRTLIVTVSLFCVMLFAETYVSYFLIWSNRIEVQDAFSYRDYIIGSQIAELNSQLKKYVVVSDTQGTIRRDYPISLQTILFLSDTFTDEKRAEKNIFYLTPEQFKNLPENHGGVVIKF